MTSIFEPPHKPITREVLQMEYLDYMNNYLTIEAYAEHRGLHLEEARMLVALMQTCVANPHPDA